MPRDPSGNYSLPALGNPAVTNTPITIAWWNGTSTDMAAALTDSLSRTGQGGMLSPFPLVDGTVGAPGLTFQSETNTGLYRAGSFDFRVTVGGTGSFQWTTGAVNCLQSFSATGTSPNGRGGTFTATGAAHGIVTTGGNSSGNAGVVGLAGSSAGYGVQGQGVSGGLGFWALSTAANIDVAKVDGYINLSGATNPAATTGFANRLTPKNLPKAFVSAFINAGTVTVRDAFNVQAAGSWTLTALFGDVTIPFATPMADTNYTVSGLASLGNPMALYVKTKNTGSVVINVMTFAAPGSPLDPTVSQFNIQLVVFGAQ